MKRDRRVLPDKGSKQPRKTPRRLSQNCLPCTSSEFPPRDEITQYTADPFADAAKMTGNNDLIKISREFVILNAVVEDSKRFREPINITCHRTAFMILPTKWHVSPL